MSTIVYRYGLLEPTVGAELVHQQIRLAHVYRNRLCELERIRRQKVRETIGEHLDMAPVVQAIAKLWELREQARLAIRAARSSSRRRDERPEMRERVREINAYLRGARAVAKVLKSAVREDPQVQARIGRVNAEHAEEMRAARAASGVYWGTYLLAERAADDARRDAKINPAFRRWDGSGDVAVQIQKGMTVGEASGCDDPRFQLSLTAQAVPGRKGRTRERGKPLPRVRLRVGSDDDRQPIWAEWPVVLHRALPKDGIIKWARARRKRVGTKFRWHLLITVETQERRESCGAGAVAVDIGWRQMHDGIRVAYWRNERGQHGELRIEPEVTSGQAKADELQGLRKDKFNVAIAQLRAWLGERTDLPDWLGEARPRMHSWKAERRLARLAVQWRNARFAGDEPAFNAVEQWRKQDRHLYEWEANARRKALARRTDQYRRFAAMLARRHDHVILERFDLRVFAEKAPAESERVEVAQVRYQRFAAAVSDLRLAVVQAFLARGGCEARVPAHDTTRACHVCALKEEWDAARHICHTCSGCGTLWDQDDNACHNLLARWCERSPDEQTPGPARNEDDTNVGASPADAPKRSGRWQRRRSKKPMAA